MTNPAVPVEAREASATRAGLVAVIGAPNAGKSTLVNRLVGAKVTIVTHKVQTTRSNIRGVWSGDAPGGEPSQIVFIDTPGIFAPKRRLDRAMVRSAWSGARDADLVLFVVDAERGLVGDAAAILEDLASVRLPRVLALNKIDRIEPEGLLALTAEANAKASFVETFMISATRGHGTDALLDYLAGAMPEHPFFFPDDQVSDLPLRQLAAEITREKLYLRLHEELPYSAHVETERWEETNKAVRIEQTIFVVRDSQKGIVLGKGGATVKAIGKAAREELTDLLGKPVHLFLHVKVRNWESDPERYREMGLKFPG